MNPTGKNISAQKEWKGLKAPWLGTKNVWKLLYNTGIVSENLYYKTQELKAEQWNYKFSEEIYKHIANQQTYITNFAKCTQIDARPLTNSVFRQYQELLKEEIQFIKPKKIITFGNQVTYNLIIKNISVTNYQNSEFEELNIGNRVYNVYPCFYPVGQGQRNMPLANQRIKNIKSL